ncbi:MAG TPA: hypothetical protein VLD67_14345 [Vicinamibacterales bacterium]|nr:hypothetical protein [Vicinamibacterales bacterium]
MIFFGVRNGTPPARVFQAIAAGLLGRDGFSGGGPTAALGVALHFFIAFTIVAVFLFASRHVPALSRAPCIAGPAYGIAVYLVMNFVVIPLSATSGGSFTVPVVLNGVLIHIVGSGCPQCSPPGRPFQDRRHPNPGGRPLDPGPHVSRLPKNARPEREGTCGDGTAPRLPLWSEAATSPRRDATLPDAVPPHPHRRGRTNLPGESVMTGGSRLLARGP